LKQPNPAVDSHAHVFCPGYPFSPHAEFIPHPTQQGSADRFAAVLDAHGISHGLLVGAGPYGPDNRCLLDALAAYRGRFKGIALVKPDVTEKELQALADAGVVGIRINLMNQRMKPLLDANVDSLFAKMKALGWFVQIHSQKDELVEAAPVLRRSGVRLMFDHFGRPDFKQGVNGAGYQALLDLGRDSEHVIKLSGPFRSSLQGPPYRDTDPYIHAAIEAFTLERCVWGSDWPWVRMEERMDYGPVYACLERWLPDEQDRNTVLWETPARLFGFAPG
jgi:predicted TIM-barrel fold metal-dependent hydrolase